MIAKNFGQELLWILGREAISVTIDCPADEVLLTMIGNEIKYVGHGTVSFLQSCGIRFTDDSLGYR